MPDYKLKGSKVRGLNQGLTFLLAGDDMDLLLEYRFSTIVEALEPLVRPIQKALQKLDREFMLKDEDGEPVPADDGDGFKVDPARRDEWEEKRDAIMEDVKGFTCPDIPMADLMRAQNEDGVVIPGWVVHSLRPLINMEGVKAGDRKKAGLEKGESKPKRGRAANVKAKAEAAEEKEGE